MPTLITHLALVMVGVLAGMALAADSATEAAAGKLVFEDKFENLDNWVSEGPNTVEIKEGKLHVKTTGEKIGQYVWLKKDVPDNFRIEFDMTPAEKASDKGFYLLFFCQQGVKGEDILGDELFNKYLPAKDWKPFQDFDKYVSAENRKQFHEARIRGYHTSYLRGESATCNLRKNPGLNLLKQEKLTEKLPKDKVAHVALTKVGGHVHLEVNGKTFMDYTDEKDVYIGGRFGFREVYDGDGYYANFKVYDLGGK